MRPFLLYAMARLGLWVLLWWLLSLTGLGLVLAGVLAALISMLLSILFLDRLRDAAAMRWKAADERRAERRADDVDEDAEYEDGLLDEAEGGTSDDAARDDVDPDGVDPDGVDPDGVDPDGVGTEDVEASGDGESLDPSGPAGLPDLEESDEVREEGR